MALFQLWFGRLNLQRVCCSYQCAMCICVSLRYKVVFAKVLGILKVPYACITNWPEV